MAGRLAQQLAADANLAVVRAYGDLATCLELIVNLRQLKVCSLDVDLCLPLLLSHRSSQKENL